MKRALVVWFGWSYILYMSAVAFYIKELVYGFN